MRPDKWAVSTQEVFQESMGVAADAESAFIESEHMLKALLGAGESNITAIIERVGASPSALDALVTAEIEASPKVSNPTMTMPS